MINLPVKEFGDLQTRPDNGALGPLVAKVADYTVKEAEAGCVFTNKGAVAAVVITLPKPLKDRTVSFIKQVTNQNFTVKGSNGAKVNGSAANGTFAHTTSAAASVVLVADGTDWLVLSLQGTWTTT